MNGKVEEKSRITISYESDKKWKINTDSIVIVAPKKKMRNVRWFMGFQDFIEELSKDREIKGEDYRVLLFLLGNMDFENWIQVTQESIAKELGMERTNVTKAIKKLSKKGIIEVAKRGRMNIYRLNPDIAWRGSYKNLQGYYKSKILDFNKEK